jgi:hypothetical protein
VADSFDEFLTEGLGTWVPVSPPRHLSPEEETVISVLLAHGFAGSEQLRLQLPSVRVLADAPGHDPSIKMSPSRDPSLAASVVDRVPVEARGVDAAGHETTVLLHVVEGFLAELEIIGGDAGADDLPTPESLTVY